MKKCPHREITVVSLSFCPKFLVSLPLMSSWTVMNLGLFFSSERNCPSRTTPVLWTSYLAKWQEHCALSKYKMKPHLKSSVISLDSCKVLISTHSTLYCQHFWASDTSYRHSPSSLLLSPPPLLLLLSPLRNFHLLLWPRIDSLCQLLRAHYSIFINRLQHPRLRR